MKTNFGTYWLKRGNEYILYKDNSPWFHYKIVKFKYKEPDLSEIYPRFYNNSKNIKLNNN